MSASEAKAQFDIDHEASTERHPEFYFDDSLVVIQVEKTLFRVHKYHLIKSDTFSDMFKLPQGPAEGLAEGDSPERPIVLEGVKSSDFAALLKVLYAVYFTTERPKCEPEIIVPAFRLAHMWNFSDLRAYLFPLVTDSLGCVDKVVLGRELGIQEWLLPAHVELCQRKESLAMEEVAKLGIHSTVMIFRLREQFHPSQSVPDSGSFWNYYGSCGGNSPVWANHGVAAGCYNCSRHMSSGTTYYRFPATQSRTAPPSSNVEIESQLKKWVEGGCVTE